MSKNSVLASLVIFLSTIAFSAHAGDITAGKTKSSKCAFCHGKDGKGTSKNPPLAGMDTKTFAAHISDFKTGKRKNPMMESMAKKLSETDVEDLASYFASL